MTIVVENLYPYPPFIDDDGAQISICSSTGEANLIVRGREDAGSYWAFSDPKPPQRVVRARSDAHIIIVTRLLNSPAP